VRAPFPARRLLTDRQRAARRPHPLAHRHMRWSACWYLHRNRCKTAS